MPDIELAKEILSRSRIVAKGRRIRDLDRLLASYGGELGRWVKRSTEVLEDSSGRFEYHWYEHHGLGRFEIRRVELDE